MNNVIYRVEGTGRDVMEVRIIDSNENNPFRRIKELSVLVTREEIELEFFLDLNDLHSLLDYIKAAHSYVSDFNSNSKPKTGPQE